MTRFIMGVQPVREAIRADSRGVVRVMVLHRAGAASTTLHAIARFAQDHGVEVAPVDSSTLDRMARGVAHQGVIAVASDLQIVNLDQVVASEPRTIIALDQISDPQNFGAIIRSAVAFGTDAVLWPEHASAPLTPATFRASAGAIEHATLCRVRKLPAAIEQLERTGMLAVGLAGDAADSIESVNLTQPVVIVVGSEGEGLRKTVRAACSRLVSLPTHPPVSTLNASVAAAVALYEVCRQRRSTASP
jgi:23S rRNA (guanosine2251-2'-O)-methyltransferase